MGMNEGNAASNAAPYLIHERNALRSLSRESKWQPISGGNRRKVRKNAKTGGQRRSETDGPTSHSAKRSEKVRKQSKTGEKVRNGQGVCCCSFFSNFQWPYSGGDTLRYLRNIGATGIAIPYSAIGGSSGWDIKHTHT